MSGPTWKLTVEHASDPVVRDGLTRSEAHVAISAVMRGAQLPSIAQQRIEAEDRDRDLTPIAA